MPDLEWRRVFPPDQISRSCWGSETGQRGVGVPGGVGTEHNLPLRINLAFSLNKCYRRPEPSMVSFLSSFGVTICGFIYLH